MLPGVVSLKDEKLNFLRSPLIGNCCLHKCQNVASVGRSIENSVLDRGQREHLPNESFKLAKKHNLIKRSKI